MLQVKNETPFVPGVFVFPDPAGLDTLYVTVKATFEIGSREVRVAGTQAPIVAADEHWGELGESSLKYAGEAHPCKPATDVVLVGAAHAPQGRPVPYFGISFSVGKLKKVVHVHGDRTWKAGVLGSTPSNPIPTAHVSLLFERAYGGRHDLGDGRFLAEMRNPVGVGFRGKRSASEMNGTPVPNLVDSRQPISSLSDRSPPAGVGHVAPAWHPRAGFAGTYDEAWRRKRAPYLPADFDPRFFQTAPPDQIYPGHLQGGEPVELINASPVGVQRFALPVCRLEAAVRIAGRVERPAMRIETLLIEADHGRFSLLWRGAVPCDKQALKIEEIALTVNSLQGVAG